jgi:sialate O-acetylesterase
MSWWLKDTTEAATEIPQADHPWMRVFSGWHPAAAEPQFEMAGGSWKVVSPKLDGVISAVGYYLAKALEARLGVPIGLLDTSTPATGIECWLSPPAAQALWGPSFPAGLGDPACYYLGKVAPLLPLGVAGVAWYQGDGSDAATGLAYRRYLPALIADWRKGFGQGDLPFLIVQIPSYKNCSPEMRESDLLAALGAPRAGLAVTLDISDPNEIHPRNKRPVGERLALLAREIAYGEKLVAWGPIFRSLTVADGQAVLTFDHCGGGLVLKGDGGFEIRAADGPWQPAQAAVLGPDRLKVWSPAVPQPAAVRYAWASVPAITLFNQEGLLASPFRSRED